MRQKPARHRRYITPQSRLQWGCRLASTSAHSQLALDVLDKANPLASRSRQDCGRPRHAPPAAVRRYKSCGYIAGTSLRPGHRRAQARPSRSGLKPDYARPPARRRSRIPAPGSVPHRRDACLRRPWRIRYGCPRCRRSWLRRRRRRSVHPCRRRSASRSGRQPGRRPECRCFPWGRCRLPDRRRKPVTASPSKLTAIILAANI